MGHERQQSRPTTHNDLVDYYVIQEGIEGEVEAVEAEISDLETRIEAICGVITEMKARVFQLDKDLPNVPWNPSVVNVVETSELAVDVLEQEAAQGILGQELATKRSRLLELQRDIAAIESIIEGSELGLAN